MPLATDRLPSVVAFRAGEPRPEQPPPVRRQAARRWAFATWAGTLAYWLSLFDRRWIPFDEGTLGQSAWRVLQGHVPHRDFDAMYTGLLDYLNAGAMQVLGVHLLVPRIVMLIAVALWIPALWSVAHRLTRSPVAASALTALAFVAGPPNYPAAMPSWFNLFFATWALWAALRWLDRNEAGALVAAGALAGLSILAKLTGLYLVAGLLFFVLHVEVGRTGAPDGQDGSGAPARAPAGSARGTGLARAFATGAVTLLVLMEVLLVRSQMGLATLVNYVLPTALVGGLLVRDAFTSGTSGGPETVRRVVRGWALVVLGVLAPVLPFLGWYALQDALPDLVRGLFVLPVQRLADVAIPVPDLASTGTVLVPSALLVASLFLGRAASLAVGLAALGTMGALLQRMDGPVFVGLFSSMLLAVPVGAAAGTAVLGAAGPASRTRGLPLLGTLWVVTMIHLIRYPFAGPTYFTNVAPLAVLALGGVVALAAARLREAGRAVRGAPLYGAVGLAYAVFLVIGPNRGGLFSPLPPPPEAPLPLERGRIVIPLAEAREYAELVEAIHALTDGPYLYATPDAPEVSFLAGLENPTRTLFEVFEDPATRTERTLAALEEHEVDLIVVNTRPFFSSMPADLAAALSEAYPLQVRVGRFLLRLREDAPARGG